MFPSARNRDCDAANGGVSIWLGRREKNQKMATTNRNQAEWRADLFDPVFFAGRKLDEFRFGPMHAVGGEGIGDFQGVGGGFQNRVVDGGVEIFFELHDVRIFSARIENWIGLTEASPR